MDSLTNRFKAAIAGAGSALQLSMYGSDQYIYQYENELGPPWKAQDLWIKLSYPFFHADRITYQVAQRRLEAAGATRIRLKLPAKALGPVSGP